MSVPSITVVGSVNLDLVAQVERLPRPGETVTDAVFRRVPGGKGANQAVACARLGADVTLVCSVGDDLFAAEALPQEERLTVDAARVAAPTGVAVILVDAEGENQIAVAPGCERGGAQGRARRGRRRADPARASGRRGDRCLGAGDAGSSA